MTKLKVQVDGLTKIELSADLKSVLMKYKGKTRRYDSVADCAVFVEHVLQLWQDAVDKKIEQREDYIYRLYDATYFAIKRPKGLFYISKVSERKASSIHSNLNTDTVSLIKVGGKKSHKVKALTLLKELEAGKSKLHDDCQQYCIEKCEGCGNVFNRYGKWPKCSASASTCTVTNEDGVRQDYATYYGQFKEDMNLSTEEAHKKRL